MIKVYQDTPIKQLTLRMSEHNVLAQRKRLHQMYFVCCPTCNHTNINAHSQPKDNQKKIPRK